MGRGARGRRRARRPGARARAARAQSSTDARRHGLQPAHDLTTPYVNTIPVELEAADPGRPELEHRLRSLIRWNAIATVLRANAESSELGGHIAAYQSAATLYEVGFNHFWHAPTDEHGGDLVYIQGHSSPGIYARAFLEGRITEEQLDDFRQEVGGDGLSSYPHPWLMPDFWQFPTVSMGLGPLMAIYQARFMKYLTGRGIADTERPQGLGVHGRRRDGRARVDGRDRAGRPRAASTTSSSSSTATCSGSTARCAATARSSRSSRPSSAAPAGT